MNLDAYNFSFNSRAPVEYKPHLEAAMQLAEVNTKERAAAFLATVGHESGDLYYLEEIADGSAYNYRADLGNTEPGDGPRYKGRGFIQLTGRNNYAAFGRWCKDQNLVSDENIFINQPELVAQPRWAAISAGYYWIRTKRSYAGSFESINDYADRRDFVSVTKAVNGGLNGWDDRLERYNSFFNYNGDILPEESGKAQKEKSLELPYSRDNVTQDTYYNCGPASTQTVVLSAVDKLYSEYELGQRLGTTMNGTDYIGQFPPVLNSLIPNAQYTYRDLTDYPSGDLKEQVWNDIVRSIRAGHGVIANIVAPPSNYPQGTRGSISPAYSGGTVYHYIAVMGVYEGQDGRHVWIADSGFPPYGYWMNFDQLCTLIPPKGYAYSTAEPVHDIDQQEILLFGPDQVGALHEAKMNSRETLEIAKEIKRDTRLILDQLVGPEQDEKGNRKFTGWPKTETWEGTGGKTFVEYLTTQIQKLKGGK